MPQTVFIVDDDPISNLVSETILKKADFADNYKTFENPNDALELLESEKPDLIFLDIVMPELDGWDFLKRCQDKEANFKVVMLTASLKPEDQERASEIERVIDIISKPLNQEFILDLKARLE